jgi:hypothetical protein
MAIPTDAAIAIPQGRIAIGDSVMLGARNELQARNIRVLAEVSRQFNDAPALLRYLKRNGELRRKVIIHLGTNGILIDPQDCNAVVRIAGRHRRVYLVTIKIERSYRVTQNRRLKSCARRHATAYLIDWYAYSQGHSSWFTGDGYHLTARGQRRYAGLLDRRSS